MASTHDTEKEWTTIAVHPETSERLGEAMPYKTMSKHEFVDVLLDHYESVSNDGS